MKIYKNPIWNKLPQSIKNIKFIQYKDSQLLTDMELMQIQLEQSLTDMELLLLADKEEAIK